MHRALAIREVVEMICSHLLQESKASLVALGITCKDLQGPALDAVWRNMDGILPWLSCLPEDLFNEPPVGALQNRRLLHLLRPLSPQDLCPANVHAVRVETFSFEFEFVFSTIFPAFHIAFPCGSLFPRLRSLSWTSTREGDFPHIRIFLTPGLSKIRIHFVPSIVNFSLFSSLASILPHLVSMKLHYLDQTDTELSVSSTSRLLRSLHRIESLTIPCLDMPAMMHLGQLHGLSHLCVESPPTGPYPQPQYSVFFPTLRSLHLTKVKLTTAIHFIRMGLHMPIESLCIEWEEHYPSQEMVEFYDIVAECCSHITLTEITLRCPSNPGGLPPRSTASRFGGNDRMLQTLFCFRNLKTLHIETTVEFDVCDNTLMDAARAWPILEDIQLYTTFMRDLPAPRVTVQSLRTFAECCPRLRVFRLTVDCDSGRPSSSLPASIKSPHPLSELFIALSPISKPVVVARILSGIFPNVRLVRFGGTRASTAVQAELLRRLELWREVEALLPEFAAAREEERTRIAAA
ncbi:hypothetical protein FB45DRAFT_800206 [Roridomyces roridus]|uniref:F-box domain-containing protein n=1 Tax=Roridomyces roridus TaxID=1738132 RepID=A0AAD7BEN3_9AGAR|nr:hypothetical protein FB45DRAFT_800206 [Roridomyces roridus]